MRHFFQSHKIDVIQKIAWQLVRSAEDRFEAGTSADKREWCVARLSAQFPKENPERLEDFVRAAFVNFRIETGDYQRRISTL